MQRNAQIGFFGNCQPSSLPIPRSVVWKRWSPRAVSSPARWSSRIAARTRKSGRSVSEGATAEPLLLHMPDQTRGDLGPVESRSHRSGAENFAAHADLRRNDRFGANTGAP